ncbi:glycosyltransferase [Siculibacillus lacustris]|uniref:Glycosyltransferase n=1 Tax=Siculibacillus lacustris TaxID=1549641 RepID=A0A4Q9VDX5_9HYPH|nr:glycosyltransferase [Siculibacillus lacustris]TBW32313.1 glycosyltransferase [Siculibacillus lacustris]
MLSVVIPTRNSEEGLARTLASLVPAAAEGVVREVVVCDDASTDGTRIVADAAGCTLVEASGGWLRRVETGVAAARRAPWFAILAPNVFLESDWFREVASFVDRVERRGRADVDVGCFRMGYDAFGWRARFAERLVAMSGALLGRPLREQGLVVSRRHWERIAARIADRSAGHGAVVARIPRRAIRVLRADAVLLTNGDGDDGTPSYGRLARIAGTAIGLPLPTDGWRED